MRRLWLLVVVLFALGAVPAGAVADGELSEGCQAINAFDAPEFDFVDDTSFAVGEVATFTFTSTAPVSVIGSAIEVAGPDGEFSYYSESVNESVVEATLEYTFDGTETGISYANTAARFGPFASTTSTCVAPPDEDGDGVPDAVDLCPDTEPDPTDGLKKNRYALDLDVTDGSFIDADGADSGITVAATGGCSGTQIIAEAGLGKGHERFGITRSALEAWIAGLG